MAVLRLAYDHHDQAHHAEEHGESLLRMENWFLIVSQTNIQNELLR